MNTAMILAAGRGERLKPITNTRPKALCTVHGVSLIEHHLQRLAAAGFTRIIINHAYLGDSIRRQLGNGSRWQVKIIYCPEPPGGLETGGGLANARPYLEHECFVTVNADIVTDYDFSRLLSIEPVQAHLVLVKQPTYYSHSDFGLLDTGLITNEPRQYTFAGIACYNPAVLKTLNPGRYSITPRLRQLATQNLLSGELHHGLWIDIGTPERLQLANIPNVFQS